MKKILIAILILNVSFAFGKAPAAKVAPQPITKLATFAGGCFWCMQPPFDKFIGQGVIETSVGYSGGTVANPSYQDVAMGKTGHAESIQVKYDPAKVSYEKLVEIYFDNIDPTDADGQFVDRGSQYRPVIFYHDAEQKKIAEDAKKKLGESKEYQKPIVVTIEAYKVFYPAEDSHQKFYDKSSIRYKIYKMGSGRESFIEEHQKH